MFKQPTTVKREPWYDSPFLFFPVLNKKIKLGILISTELHLSETSDLNG